MQPTSPRKRLLRQRRFRQLLAGLFIISVLLSIAIVPFERGSGSIKTTFDGAWWAVTTLTTVGYGDLVPITSVGRWIGIILQIVGTVMFGMIIAAISSSMNRLQDEFYWNRLFERLNRIESELESLKRRTGFIVKGKEENKSSKLNH